MRSTTKRTAPRLSAPRIVRRAKRPSEFDVTDATWTTDPSTPETVFDRATGPFGSLDEET